jgi:recombinational DNA repair protein RecR
MTKEEIQKNSEHWYNKYKDAEKRIADLEETNAILSESAAINQKGLEYKVSVIEQRNKRIAELEQQIEKMKVCSNCKHFNKAEDNEYCWNCERHLVNSLDNLKAEEIIKDEWEIKEK